MKKPGGVLRLAGVIKARRAIIRPAARAPEQHVGGPTPLRDGSEQRRYVVRAFRAFESVKQHKTRRLSRLRICAYHNHVVAVGRLPRFTPRDHWRLRAYKLAPERLNVWVSRKPRCAKRRCTCHPDRDVLHWVANRHARQQTHCQRFTARRDVNLLQLVCLRTGRAGGSVSW